MYLNNSMKKQLFFLFLAASIFLPVSSFAGLPKIKKVNIPVPHQQISGVRALIKQDISKYVSNALLRKTLEKARHNFTGPAVAMQLARRSLVQISMPHYSSVLGSGFVLSSHGKTWVAMPYHLGGPVGGTRVVRIQKRDGSVAEKELTVALNGTAGWHEADVSLALLPEEWKPEVEPWEIAPAVPDQEVYSFGYVAGELGMTEILPVTSRFLHVDRAGMLRTFHIPGSTMDNPVSGNGYCGSVLLQKINGHWKAVGMHNGHSMDLENPSASVGSSVNLAASMDYLLDNYFEPISMNRGLTFRGWELARLDVQERVDSVMVIRADGSQPFVRYLRNFPSPYSDDHAEMALADIDLQSGDKLIFTIAGRTSTKKRVHRQVEFVLP